MEESSARDKIGIFPLPTHEELVLLSKYFVAGAAARVSAAVVMSPVDTVKTRLQFQGRYKSVRRYAGATEAFRLIFKEEGIWGFFKGLPPRLMYITPAAAVSFMFYEQFKVLLRTRGPQAKEDLDRRRKMLQLPGSHLHPAVPLVAGGLARLFGTAARTPFDILRQRLQVQGTLKDSVYKGKGTFGALRILLKEEGIKGLWTGYSISVMRDAPFAAVYFLSYEVLKSLQAMLISNDADDTERLKVYNHLLAGAGAGAMAATCTIPLDVIKTRLQTQPTLPPEERGKYKGIMGTFNTIAKEEGLRGLTQGLGARLMYLVPAASLTFAAYEQYKRMLGLTS